MDEDAVLGLLEAVEDPYLGSDLVSLGLVNDVTVDGSRVRVSLGLGAPYSPAETHIAEHVRGVLEDAGLEPELSARVDRGIDPAGDPVPDVKNILAVASGKGGVGKSTIAVNLAVGLADMGARVGLFDADVYGPNVPRMLDTHDPPTTTPDETITPPEVHGVRVMSMDFLVGRDDPVIWRGPMVHKVLTQLVEDVDWGPLDYFVLDLPPGTGDTQLTVLQTLRLSGAVIVTTPQEVAVDDARKALQMFARHDTVVLGIVENMAGFVCPDCNTTHEVFGTDGGSRLADEADLPLLGRLPLDPRVRLGADGRPVVLNPDTQAGAAFQDLTHTVADYLGVIARQRHRDALDPHTTTPAHDHDHDHDPGLGG